MLNLAFDQLIQVVSTAGHIRQFAIIRVTDRLIKRVSFLDLGKGLLT